MVFADLVREFSSSAGAGDFVLGGAVPGHRAFSGVVPAGVRFHYAIAGVTRPQEWEAGEGEIGSGGALVRVPDASSAGGALVDFSPGLKVVTLTVGAAWFRAREEAVTGIGDVEGLAAALAGKAAAGHDHDGAYASAGHDHDEDYAAAGHDHDGVYAAVGHDHDGAYAAAGHDHSGQYQPAGANLAALAGLSTGADKVAYWTGGGAAALTHFSAAGRALVGEADSAGQRATLGLGSAARSNVGTAGPAVPLLDGVNSWSGVQRFAAGATVGTVVGLTQAADGGSYVQARLAPTAGNRAFVLMFAPSGTATSSVMEFYASSSLATSSRHIFKNSSGTLQIGGDGAALPIQFIFGGSVGLSLNGTLGNYANDAAAAAGGVPIAGMYRNGSVLMVRVA
jgi:hypothetical protein